MAPPTYTRKQWEEYCVRLLQARYPLGEFQPVPATDRGDYGIEGFATDGCAFQCYASEALATGDLYEHQRSKMHEDIQKFINNSAGLKKLLAGIVIKNWVFLVPEVRSKKLIEYAGRKQEEVRSAKLSYAHPEFHISVLTDDAFATERAMLIHTGAQVLHLPELPVPPSSIDAWESNASNDPLNARLADKIGRMSSFTAEPMRHAFRREMIRRFIAGENMLDQVRAYSPETWEDILEIKTARESVMRAEQILSGHTPQRFIETQREELVARYKHRITGLSHETFDTLSWEAISEWLVRCPLDF